MIVGIGINNGLSLTRLFPVIVSKIGSIVTSETAKILMRRLFNEE
jgi:hypothetical protein